MSSRNNVPHNIAPTILRVAGKRCPMPDYKDPGVFCKCCCPACAVYQAQGCKCPEMLLALVLESCYTMLCWDPTTGIKNCAMATETAPPAATAEMARK